RELRWDTELWRQRLRALPPEQQVAVTEQYDKVSQQLAEVRERTPDIFLASDEVLRPVVLEYMWANPERTLLLFVRKMRTLYSAFTPTMSSNEFTTNRNRWLAAASYYPVVILALIGAWVGLRYSYAVAPLYLLIFSVSSGYSLLTTCTRFRLPLDPYLIVF